VWVEGISLLLPQPDPEVLRRAQRGEEEAFALIVHAYQARVLGFVLRLVGERGRAEELTQDVFLRVFLGLRGFAGRSLFTTWLFQVAQNIVRDELRADQCRPRTSLTLEQLPHLVSVDAPLEQAETMAALWRAVESLPEELRSALLLRDIAGLSYAEIAETLALPLSTVKWRIHDARSQIVLVLRSDGLAEPPRRRPRQTTVTARRTTSPVPARAA
jgi:RNA polymerase sigma-70 factor, ECF subfamily